MLKNLFDMGVNLLLTAKQFVREIVQSKRGLTELTQPSRKISEYCNGHDQFL